MGWRTLNAPATKKPNQGSGITATLRKATHAKKPAPAKLVLSISTAVMGGLGWGNDEVLTVMVGDGTEHGRIRVLRGRCGPHANAYHRLCPRRSGRIVWAELRLGELPQFVDRQEKGQWCPWQEINVAGGGTAIEITLPAWAAETAPPPPAPTHRSTRARAMRGSPSTAHLPGDPPDGRSALGKCRGR